MSETNKTIVKRFVEEYQGENDTNVLYETVSPELVNRTPMFPNAPGGPIEVKAIFDMFRAAFDDFAVEILGQLAEGDKVVTYKTMWSPTRRSPVCTTESSWASHPQVPRSGSPSSTSSGCAAVNSSSTGEWSTNWACCDSSERSRRRAGAVRPWGDSTHPDAPPRDARPVRLLPMS